MQFNSKETTTERGMNRVSDRGCYEIQICAGKMNGEGRNGERKKDRGEGNNIRGIGGCTQKNVKLRRRKNESKRNIRSEKKRQHKWPRKRGENEEQVRDTHRFFLDSKLNKG